MDLARRIFFAASVAVTLGIGVVGCSTEPPARHAELTFGHLQPLTLNVASIEVVSKYIPPMKAPNVEHRAQMPPYTAVRRWAKHRVVAGGVANRARMVILDASIREMPLKTTGGVRGLITTDQSERYEGRVAVLLEILEPRGRQLGFVTARAEQRKTVPENATLSDRERVWFELTEEMMRKLDKALTDGVAAHIASYVKR